MKTLNNFNEIMFYLFILVFIAWEIKAIINPTQRHTFISKLKQKLKNKEKCTNLELSYIVFNVAYTVYVLTSIFGTQWTNSQRTCFLIILGLSFIPKTNKNILLADAVATVCILIYIVINEIFLHF